MFMQPTGDYLNILKIKPPRVTSKRSVDFFVDMLGLTEDELLLKFEAWCCGRIDGEWCMPIGAESRH